MTKLPSVRPKAVAKVAVQLGFIFDRQKGSHAVFFRAADRRRIVIPMHNKDLKPGTLRGIISDMDISPEEFAGYLKR